jgi:predicted DNA-binding protein (MmcQ/YjbR family)
MTGLAAFDRYCRGLKGSNFVVQWGGCHVHKVGPKLIAFSLEGGYVFKATPMAFALLTEQGLARRAPYLRQGYWLYVEQGALKQADLFGYLQDSYRLAVAALTRAQRRELGLD